MLSQFIIYDIMASSASDTNEPIDTARLHDVESVAKIDDGQVVEIDADAERSYGMD